MLPWYFCGNFPKSHLPLKLYSADAGSAGHMWLPDLFSSSAPEHMWWRLCVVEKKKKEKRKKVAPLPTPQRIWASCVCFCSPCQPVKLDPYIPLPWRQVTSYTSGCTGLCQRHECSREEECWLGSAIAKVFPTAGHLGEQQWTVCKGCLEI